MTKVALIVVISSAFSIALGKALDYAPIPQWLEWALLALALFLGVFIIRGVEL